MPVGTRMVADGDANSDKMLSREEITAVVAAWFDKADTQKIGRVTQADFVKAYDTIMPPRPPAAPRAPRVGNGQAKATELGPDDQVGTWPEFNTLLGGFFKFHWNDGQPITYKIDDPASPLTAPFKGKTPFVVADETYTFGREVYSRKNLRVLTSVDMAAMSAEDKAKEQFPRPDGDTRAQLDPCRAEGPRLLHVARPQREGLRQPGAAAAPARRPPVRHRRPAGRRHAEQQVTRAVRRLSRAFALRSALGPSEAGAGRMAGRCSGRVCPNRGLATRRGQVVAAGRWAAYSGARPPRRDDPSATVEAL